MADNFFYLSLSVSSAIGPAVHYRILFFFASRHQLIEKHVSVAENIFAPFSLLFKYRTNKVNFRKYKIILFEKTTNLCRFVDVVQNSLFYCRWHQLNVRVVNSVSYNSVVLEKPLLMSQPVNGICYLDFNCLNSRLLFSTYFWRSVT